MLFVYSWIWIFSFRFRIILHLMVYMKLAVFGTVGCCNTSAADAAAELIAIGCAVWAICFVQPLLAHCSKEFLHITIECSSFSFYHAPWIFLHEV